MRQSYKTKLYGLKIEHQITFTKTSLCRNLNLIKLNIFNVYENLSKVSFGMRQLSREQ